MFKKLNGLMVSLGGALYAGMNEWRKASGDPKAEDFLMKIGEEPHRWTEKSTHLRTASGSRRSAVEQNGHGSFEQAEHPADASRRFLPICLCSWRVWPFCS